MTAAPSTLFTSALRWLVCAAACALAGVASADPADIANVPPSTMTASTVRPNLMFILDDSGSMGNEYLPDEVGSDADLRCYGYFGHNRVFFNPSFTYPVPLKADGSPYPNATFNSTKSDGFASNPSTVDLSKVGNLQYRYLVSSSSTSCSGSQCYSSDATDSGGLQTVVTYSCNNKGVCSRTTKQYQHYYYVTLNGGGTDNCTNTNYTAVTTLSSTHQQNYANWYQYYRTRMLMMRSSAGQVFSKIDASRFRVGFSTISYTGVTEGSDFLNIADFDLGTGSTSQKSKFFSKLYGQTPSGSTPLRPALQKAGRYFANKASGQTVDPMQYSCQRNYTLLSTDGYWNTAAEPSQFIPTKLDGSAVGDLDGVSGTPRPKYDASKAKNSLADISKYYYDTDLRTSALGNCFVGKQDVCANREPKPGDTTPTYQNMSTFTLGLGIPGKLNYQTDYASAKSGDYYDIAHGTKDWPDPLSSSNSGYADTGNTVTSRIDDLWHAAVNGGGYYYSAGNPNDLVLGLTDALSRINAEAGAAAAAATSTLRPVVGDDWVFLPAYETQTWVGDVSAFHLTIEPKTGAVSLGTAAVWNAAKSLAAQSTRRVLMYDSKSSNGLKDFSYSNLSSSQKAYFDNLCLAGAYKLSQCGNLTAGAIGKVTGANVVDFLLGKNQYEQFQTDDDNKVFRSRLSKKGEWTPLGDVINSSPVYVRVPPFKYDDAGYSAFKSTQKDRQGMVYVGANDGMLHAFRVSDGQEVWAYVPTVVMPEMYRLADVRYGNAHRFFVDSTPVIADVYYNSAWRTVLIGGLGAGGRAYYALDVTDPNSPQALWEFTDNNLGYTFGNPVVGKNKAGTWVVAFTSGYNNNASGDGNGRLFVLDAVTGKPAISSPIETFNPANGSRIGSVTTPNNLGSINAWVDKEWDNTLEYVYGGDMLGNVWRFDFDDRIAPAGREAFLLGKTQSPSGEIQPITVAPILGALEVSQSGITKRAVTVGTGRYLGQSDLPDVTVQSLYTFRDKLDGTALGVLRDNTGMVKQSMNASHAGPVTANVDWETVNGWYIDFDQKDPLTGLATGERVNVEMDLQLGIVTVSTTLASATPCSPGGTSWLYYFGFKSGALLASENSPVLIVGLTSLLENSGSDPRMATVSVRNDGSFKRTGAPYSTPNPTTPGALKRTSWRELVN